MSRHDDESHTDSAWREIVENYGERARLDEPVVAPEPVAEEPRTASYGAAAGPEVEPSDDLRDDVPETERFRPPDPPPVPLPSSWQRRAAWGGVFVAPVLAVLLALADVRLPGVLAWGLVAWFVGGFLYLVATMPRTPREPWDDGSRV